MKFLTNPDYGISNYDNLLTSCLQVFKIITSDDWTSSMFIIQKTFTKFVWIYYVSLVVFGNFFMMNLILAVLKVKYGEYEMKMPEIAKEKGKVFELKELREKRIIISKNKNMRKLRTVLPKIMTESGMKNEEAKKEDLKNVIFFNL